MRDRAPVGPGTGEPSRPAPVIAIDGPAGSGKSSTAIGVARALGFDYVDSGAYYRAATLLALRRGLPGESGVHGPAIARALSGAELSQRVTNGSNEVRLGGEDVSRLLRSLEVARLVGGVAADPAVRAAVTDLLRKAAAGREVVMDGRDIGTVIFPDAVLKVFLEASIEERARRRSAAEGREVSASALARRDDQDRGRAEAPLTPAPDAVLLVTDDLTLVEQVSRIVELYRARAG